MATRKIPNPKLHMADVHNEIAKRVGLHAGTVKRVLDVYSDVIKQCLLNKVEVPFCDIGTVGYKIIPPYERKEWKAMNGYGDDRTPIIFYQDKTDGYIKPIFRVRPKFIREMRSQTIIPYGTMPSLDNAREYSKESLGWPLVNYDEYLREKNPEKYITEEEVEWAEIDPENTYSDYDILLLDEEQDQDEEDLREVFDDASET